ncbi:MAG: SH3 domain-containing protein [Microcoleus sp. PH2017_17_BER_D_A]|nr:SH3 domain-containing protein [Microcoleus sp. PH2017_17_BER_D_A]
MNSIYSVFKFLVGFLLAIVLMAGASVAAALYFAAKLTTVPDRPVFPNDKTAAQIAGAGAKSTAKASPVSTSSDAASGDAASEKPLEPGAYRALVTQPIGLILRDSGNRDSNRIGGVGYKEKVVVLEDSPDKEWQRIRVEDGNREGWVHQGWCLQIICVGLCCSAVARSQIVCNKSKVNLRLNQLYISHSF